MGKNNYKAPGGRMEKNGCVFLIIFAEITQRQVHQRTTGRNCAKEKENLCYLTKTGDIITK